MKRSRSANPAAGVPSAEQDLRRFERLVVQLAGSCIDLDPTDIDGGLDAALAAVGEFLGARRAYVFLHSESGALRSAYEWCRGDLQPAMGELGDLGALGLRWFLRRLSDREVVHIASLDELPGEAAAERARFSAAGIHSLVAIPIAIPGRFFGFLGAHSIDGPIRWSGEVEGLLRLVGESLANSLARREEQHSLRKTKERFEIALLGANDGMWDWDLESRSIYFSPRWKEMLGYADEDLDFEHFDWRTTVHPDDLPRVEAGLIAHLEGRTSLFESVHRVRHKAGGYRWLISRAKAITDDSGRLKRLVGVELDISDRKYFEAALSLEKERALTTLASISEAVITTVGSGRIDYLNPAAERITGWAFEDVRGRDAGRLLEQLEGGEGSASLLLEHCLAGSGLEVARRTLHVESRGDRPARFLELSVAPIRSTDQTLTGALLILRDVTESRELNRQLSYQASHDALTGLINRREFESRLRQALDAARARGLSHALCYLDLDQFKVINDTCGHAAGDALLGQLGALLKSCAAEGDTVARLGGDEFGILLDDCKMPRAQAVAERVREAIGAFRFNWEGKSFRLGVSIGLVPVTARSASAGELLSTADSACYAAKDAGRNRIHTYREDDRKLRARRREMQWVSRINLAMEDGRLDLYRQRIQRLDGRDEGAHYEVLLRMRDEEGSIIGPDAFIAAAERFSIMPALDRWVVGTALKWLAENRSELERLGICSLNISGQTLGDNQFLEFLVEQFRLFNISAKKFCFEITETAAISNLGEATRMIRVLRDLGAHFALDDFGSGLSSFGYLKNLPVDFLKIDGSFIRGIVDDPIDREMVRAINEVGHLTGKRTIAEFAETAAILVALREMGVDYAQGFGVAEPEYLIAAS